jgi:hypothetical protein
MAAPAAKGTLIQDGTISVQIDGVAHAAQTLSFALNCVATEIAMGDGGQLNTTIYKGSEFSEPLFFCRQVMTGSANNFSSSPWVKPSTVSISFKPCGVHSSVARSE